MSRTRFIPLWATIAASCLFPIAAAGHEAEGASPSLKAGTNANVVLIVLDALRLDRVYGQRNGVQLMPYLSTFAQGCVRFTNAHPPCTWTRPSMSSVLTSLYVDTHQVYWNSPTAGLLLDKFETMATFFKKAGYGTTCVMSNGNMIPAFGMAQGFDQYDYLGGAAGEAVTAQALQRIDSLTEPFFLYVHYVDTHPPFEPPTSYRTLMGFPDPQLDPAERAIAENFMDYFNDHVDYRLGLKPKPDFTPLSPRGEEAVRMLYDGAALYEDYEMGLVADRIQTLFHNTIIIVIADHGEHLWEHGYLGHGLTMYEPLLRIPFFMKGPGLAPRDVDMNVNTIDILPTVAALLGLPARPAWQGRDLFSERDPLAPTFSYTKGSLPPRNVDLDMVKLGSTKLIYDRRSGQAELYDVVADPGDTTNLASQRPQQVDQFRALLDAHRARNIRARN